jgi:hypothetical protein
MWTNHEEEEEEEEEVAKNASCLCELSEDEGGPEVTVRPTIERRTGRNNACAELEKTKDERCKNISRPFLHWKQPNNRR